MGLKFLRRQGDLLSKLGRRRKKKQVWRRPTGRDNKMREKRRGYPKVVSIGYKKPEGEKIKIVRNVQELEKIKGKMIVIGRVGKKKRMEIERLAKEKKIKILNLKRGKPKENSKKLKIKEDGGAKNELKK